MPAVPRIELTKALANAIEESGASAHVLSQVSSNPIRLSIQHGEDHFTATAYIWTLTFGGRKTLPDEYRIQMTTVGPPLEAANTEYAVLLGYEPDLQLFAGFDFERHKNFTPGSPSVQVDINVVREAGTDGLALKRKGNEEVVVGIRPDMLLTYVRQAPDIHEQGKEPANYDLLEKAVESGEVTESDLEELSGPRKRTVQEVAKWSRNRKFRRCVLQAYEHRCAITGMQLRLVEAAHILPVGAPGSTDEVPNGIALSPTYHRAFDRGLIYLAEDRRFHLNRERVEELKEARLSAGLRDFASLLDRTPILPSNASQRPSEKFIALAREFRAL